MDKRFNFVHSNAKKVWFINDQAFYSDKGTNNGKQKAIAYAREHMLNDKEVKKFDSEMEFKRYLFLRERERKGEIDELKDHFNFQLLPAFESYAGIEHEELVYEADFYYFDNDIGQFIVEDVKGNLEDTFRCKWKLFDYIYGKKRLAIQCVRLRAHADHMNAANWVYLGEVTQPKKRSASMREKLEKQKAENKRLSLELKEREKLKELSSKEKLTKAQRVKLEELKAKYGG